MHKEQYIINQSGVFDQNIVEKILKLIKIEVSKIELDCLINKRIYSAAVECLDNILKHSELLKNYDLEQKYPSRFYLKDKGDTIIMYSGNVMLNENVRVLMNQFEELSTMKFDKLNQLYKSKLQNAKISDRGGAGLGLIIMAKIAGKKISYNFEKINDKFSFFALQIEFNKIL